MIQTHHSKLGDDKMSDRAQRVLDALMDYHAKNSDWYPIQTIGNFLDIVSSFDCDNELSDDYEALSIDEEKQVIQAFLEFAY